MENIKFNVDFLTQEVIEKIDKWVEYCNNGHYGSSRDIVDTYNGLFNGYFQKHPYTQCGSCIRKCVFKMRDALAQYRELIKEEEPQISEIKKTRGRPPKVTV